MALNKSVNLKWDPNDSKGSKRRASLSRNSRHSISRRLSHTRGSDPKLVGSLSNINPVFDNGKDVTPKALFTGATHEKSEQMKLEDASASTDYKSLASMLQTGLCTGLGTGMFGKSALGSGIRNSVRSMSIASQSALFGQEEEEKDIFNTENSDDSMDSIDIEHIKRPYSGKPLTEEELEELASIQLEETDTITILNIQGTAVCEETEKLELIQEINEDYKALCASRLGNDKYAERGMMTFNNHSKQKEAATNFMGIIDVGCQVSSSILWDAFNTEREITSQTSLGSILNGTREPERKKSLSETIASESSLGDTISSQPRTVPKRQLVIEDVTVENQHDEILQSDEMSASLLLVERILTQNIYQQKISAFRGLPQLDSYGNPIILEKQDPQENLNRLWTFKALNCKGYTVTSIAWNRINPDIMAVSYGYNVKHKSADSSDSNAGLVCCWNIKNLEHPERIYHLPSCATCCDFSQANPNLLAVGLYNGLVVVFNVTRKGNTMLLDSADSVDKHLGPVWSVRWIDRERGTDERGEVLVSTSADGRVVQWTIRKGFESLVLMKVKRLEVRSKKSFGGVKKDTSNRKTESARISQFAPTTSFDFHPRDGNTYLIGTEEGTVHRCSCSYNEQTLDTYIGHSGPVYATKWHPHVSDVFLSCSEDWTIRIWHQKHVQPVITFQSGQRPIKHVEWSPYTSTLFVTITDVSVDVWDITASILDPVISMPFRSGNETSIFGFSPNSNCIVVGDTDGTVNVFQVQGFKMDKSGEEVRQIIEDSLNTH